MTEVVESLVERSKAFAVRAHQSINHTRKYTGDPYINHLEAVASMVAEVSGTPEMVAAAWLHDSVEDTPTTIEEIEEEFGSTVATLVFQLTDISRPEDGNRATRKALDRAHIAQASPEAKTIKLADLIDNASSIEAHDPRFAKTYMAEKRLLLTVLREGHISLYEKATKVVNDYYQRTDG